MTYDPTEFSSPEEYAKSRAAMDREFGMPSKPYDSGTEVGRLINEDHFRHQAAMNDEFGWHGTTREGLRKKWDL